MILRFHLLSRLSHVHWVDSSSPFGVRIKLLIYAYTFVRTEKRDGVERGRRWPDSIIGDAPRLPRSESGLTIVAPN
jgi:hypothetical protein